MHLIKTKVNSAIHVFFYCDSAHCMACLPVTVLHSQVGIVWLPVAYRCVVKVLLEIFYVHPKFTVAIVHRFHSKLLADFRSHLLAVIGPFSLPLGPVLTVRVPYPDETGFLHN